LRIGSGVQLGNVQRITNKFLEGSLRTASSQQGEALIKNDYLARIENVFNLSGPQMTVGTAMNDFFSSINEVGVDPSNLDLRLNVLQRGQDLVTVINNTFQEIAAAQDELNYQVGQQVSIINSLTDEIAGLNSIVAQREAVGVSAIDERDQRDVLLNKLSEKISFELLETPNGAINLYLDNGFPIVHQSTSRPLEVTTTPSFAAGTLPPSLSGGVLSYVVYNFGSESAPSHLDLTSVIKNGEGALGGVLELRGTTDTSSTSAYEADGDLVRMAARVEAVAKTLLTEVNQVYRGNDEDTTTPGFEPSSADLNGNPPGVFGLFDFDFSGVKDADGDGLATIADLTASGIDSFSSILRMGFSTPDEFAAGRDVDPTEGSTAFVGGNGDNAVALADLRTQSFAFDLVQGSFNGTFDELYNSSVSIVGSIKAAAQNEYQVAEANLLSAQTKRDEFSSVSLDEEFANVIKYQKAFQASARMIRTASEIIDTIVSLI
jgi:flagellar hook-associated protein 1 FlgK